MQRVDPLPHDTRSAGFPLVGDRDLVRRCIERDRTALQELYRRYGAAVHSAASVVAQRPGAPSAEELTVAAFTALWHDARAAALSTRPVLGQLVVLCGRHAALSEERPLAPVG